MASPENSDLSYRPDLDGLRAIAASAAFYPLLQMWSLALVHERPPDMDPMAFSTLLKNGASLLRIDG